MIKYVICLGDIDKVVDLVEVGVSLVVKVVEDIEVMVYVVEILV